MYRVDLTLAYPYDKVDSRIFQGTDGDRTYPVTNPASRNERVGPPFPTTDTPHIWTTSAKGGSVNRVIIGNMSHVSWTHYEICCFLARTGCVRGESLQYHIYAWQKVCEGLRSMMYVCICPVSSYFAYLTHVSLCSHSLSDSSWTESSLSQLSKETSTGLHEQHPATTSVHRHIHTVNKR
jgi:hypothetical protein